jgi:hypothetical protein
VQDREADYLHTVFPRELSDELSNFTRKEV